jgi:hypothetical protein
VVCCACAVPWFCNAMIDDGVRLLHIGSDTESWDEARIFLDSDNQTQDSFLAVNNQSRRNVKEIVRTHTAGLCIASSEQDRRMGKTER